MNMQTTQTKNTDIQLVEKPEGFEGAGFLMAGNSIGGTSAACLLSGFRIQSVTTMIIATATPTIIVISLYLDSVPI